MWGYRKIEYMAECFRGCVRQRNEDNFYCNGVTMPLQHADMKQPVNGTESTRNSPIFAICDGMGGEVSGEIASFIGVETVRKERKKHKDLESLIRSMNQKVCEYARKNHISFMGSTAAILKMKGGMVQGANIGDSTIFLFVCPAKLDHTCRCKSGHGNCQ